MTERFRVWHTKQSGRSAVTCSQYCRYTIHFWQIGHSFGICSTMHILQKCACPHGTRTIFASLVLHRQHTWWRLEPVRIHVSHDGRLKLVFCTGASGCVGDWTRVHDFPYRFFGGTVTLISKDESMLGCVLRWVIMPLIFFLSGAKLWDLFFSKTGKQRKRVTPMGGKSRYLFFFYGNASHSPAQIILFSTHPPKTHTIHHPDPNFITKLPIYNPHRHSKGTNRIWEDDMVKHPSRRWVFPLQKSIRLHVI